ncbi:hypothetical protein EYS14_01950 [Alteromonadaceae bacterium M269]|nr:hypothetical protein EYS14_01950 [Alteromonadaceae bacterium M269]
MRLVTSFLLVVLSFGAKAKLVDVEVAKKTDFTAYGQELQAIEGHLVFEFDPSLEQNKNIVDLELAKKKNGKVQARSTFFLIQQADPKDRKGTLIEISNRGSKASLRYFNQSTSRGVPETAEAIGDGLIQRLGLSLMWVGWQPDVFAEGQNMSVELPRVINTKGVARSDWTVEADTNKLRVAHRDAIDVLYTLDKSNAGEAYLTRRYSPNGLKTVIPASEWRFSEDGDALLGSFSPGIYELVYPTQESVIIGLGLALIRDAAEYVKQPESMFTSPKTIAFGVSQTGRWLRHFLYQGFNQTESGTKAFDGMLIHTAGAGRGSFNHRFGQTSRDAHRMSAFFYPTDVFPFTSRETEHPLTGEKDGLLSRLDDKFYPKIFYTNTGYEYWGRAAALIHSDKGKDIEPLANERIYHLASGQHFVERQNNLKPIDGVDGYYQGNPLNFLLNLRALLSALAQWVVDDVEPPKSQYPRFADKTLGQFEDYKLPKVLNGFKVPVSPHTAYINDYGEQWSQGVITQNPPRLLATIVPPVPTVDGYGNERSGVRHPLIREPLASFLPWVLRHNAKFANDEMMDFRGSLKLLAKDDIVARYKSWDSYNKRLNKAIDNSVNEGVLLEEDRESVRQQAKWLWDLATE